MDDLTDGSDEVVIRGGGLPPKYWRKKMNNYRIKWIFFLLLVLFVWGHIPFEDTEYSEGVCISSCFGRSKTESPENQKEKDIQWFREEMKISPKYMEREEGVLGMSWTHFFTMLFLVLFFIGTIVALVLRHRRTKQLLSMLLKEERLPETLPSKQKR